MSGLPGDSESGEKPIMPDNSFKPTPLRSGERLNTSVRRPVPWSHMGIQRHKSQSLHGKLLYVPSRAKWRAWLKKHYRSETEVWLVFPKAGSGKPRVSYNDAVEEALCFGWIDSIVRGLDDDRYAQRFSVRRAGSKYSQANIERLRFLVREGSVSEDIRGTLPDLDPGRFRMPKDIAEAMKASPKTWKNFRSLSKSYVRIRVAYIESARKRPVEFRKRLAHFIRMTEQGRRIGFGGIEKHY
jgi:uncharacterized protein YdeI (YjbR/CyaY-like superfamily)